MAVAFCTRFIFYAAMLVAITTAGLEVVCERAARGTLHQRIGAELGRGAAEMADKLDREMSARYSGLQMHAILLTDLDLLDRPDAVRNRLDALHAAYPGFAWLGYTNNDGKVLAASGRLLEGQNVSEHTWFKSASRTAFVADPHRAILLENHLKVIGKTPPRFLDIAMPVVKKDHSMAGVLGAHLEWQWIQDIAQSTARNERSDILIVSTGNSVLFGPADLQDLPLHLDSVRQAQHNQSGFGEEHWPDGKIYLTGYGQTHGYKSYPGLGWSILYRLEVGEVYAPVAALRLQFLVWGILAVAIAAWLGWLTATRITRPLIGMTEAVKSFAPGASAFDFPSLKDYSEVAELASALQTLVARLTQSVMKPLIQPRLLLDDQEAEVVPMHLPNRATLMPFLSQTIQQASRGGKQIAVLTLSVSHLQTNNETVRRDGGNSALNLTAIRLDECVNGSGIVGHLGDNDFVVILSERGDLATGAGILAARMQQAIAEPVVVKNKKYFLSAGVGISLFPKDGQSATTLLDCSEIALHQAQRLGDDTIAFYEIEKNALVRERIALERELRQALDEQQCELHYQPQVSLASGAIVGVEALIHWRHPKKGFVSPAKFIPVAEASGFIVRIDIWVLETACTQASEWRNEGLPTVRVGINVSAQLFAQADFVTRVESVLARNQLPAEWLQLELADSFPMQDVEHSVSHMNELTALGVRIAINDFGTGHSSLCYLKRFPISELKIGQAFLSELTSQSDDASILSAIILLAHNLKLSVIAKGVETAEQMRALRLARCDEIQGSVFSRPIPSLEMMTLLRSRKEVIGEASEDSPSAEMEAERIAALLRFQLLDTPPEAQFDELTQLAADICGTPIALISLVDSTRQWFKSRVNFEYAETDRNISFCGHAILGEGVFEVANATIDERFCNNPRVTGSPYIVFYAGAPLVSHDGYRIGTLCVIDRIPRQLTVMQRRALATLSRQAMRLIENHLLTRELRNKEYERVVVADASPVGMFRTNARHDCIYVNKKYTAITGLQLGQAGGQGWVAAVHSEDRSRFLASLELSTLRNSEYLSTQRFVRPDGSTVLCRVAGAPISTEGVFSGFVGTLEDVTERQGLTNALALSEKRLKTITDNLPVLITYIDRERRIRFANATLELWMGVSPAIIRDRRFEDVFGETIYAERQHHIERALQGKHVEFDITSSANGVERHLHSIYIPDRDQNGTVHGFYTLTTDVTMMKLSENRLTKLARLDSLTDLPNRYFLNELLSAALSRSNHSGTMIIILYLDIDYFKDINDTYGHAIGDAVLIEFAKRLKQCVRVEDTVARLAGDEFVIVIESSDHSDDAQLAAQRISEKTKQPWQFGQHLVHVSTSIGVVCGYPVGSTAADLLDIADKALYEAKREGRNRFKLVTLNG